MAWNEPGKGQDPWGGGNNNNGGGPPDLDQIWQRLRARLSKSSNGKSGGGNGGGGGPSLNPMLLLWLIPVILVIWLLTGFYVVQPGEQGVLLRFGRYTQTVDSGWHWYWPTPIGHVISVDTQNVRSASTRGIVLTKDESLAEIEVSLQYRVDDAMHYLFQLTNPDRTVKEVLKSAVREMVGTSRLNQVIQEGVQPEDLDTEGLENVDLKQSSDEDMQPNPLASLSDELLEKVKQQKQRYPDISSRSRALLPSNIKEILQTTLDQYKAGIDIIAVNVQYAQPPEAVQSAFEEAIKAREEKEQKKNIARAYARQVLARAKGQKAKLIADAKAYESHKVANAKGAVARFSRLLTEYEKAPEVTHRRLYLETMGDVLGAARLVVADKNKDGGPLMYLPLPGLNGKSGAGKSGHTSNNDSSSLPPMNSSSTSSASNSSAASNSGSRADDNLRSRSRNP